VKTTLFEQNFGNWLFICIFTIYNRGSTY